MLPKAKLMIYIPINDELIYDEQTIDFQQNLLNDVCNADLFEIN